MRYVSANEIYYNNKHILLYYEYYCNNNNAFVFLVSQNARKYEINFINVSYATCAMCIITILQLFDLRQI